MRRGQSVKSTGAWKINHGTISFKGQSSNWVQYLLRLGSRLDSISATLSSRVSAGSFPETAAGNIA